MAAIKPLRKRLNDTRYGNGVHFTLTGTLYHITLNNLELATTKQQIWAQTVWFSNKLSGEEVTMDWVLGTWSMWDQVQKFPPILLEDYMNHYHGELDFNDDSGKDWDAAVSIRALTTREVERLIEDGVELSEKAEDDQYSVMYYGELLPYEECEFDEPLTNLRPDIAKIFKLNKKRK